MKQLWVMSVVFSLVGSVAMAGECEKKAEKVVLELEKALIKIDGFAQGDLEKPVLVTSLKTTEGKYGIYAVTVPHMNDENETWSNQYEVKLTQDGCYLNSYKFLGFK